MSAIHSHGHEDLKISKSDLKFAIIASTVVFLIELGGGLWANSLAVLSDSLHIFTDVLSYAMSLSAIFLAENPVTERRTFGWHRLEVFAAILNGIALVLLSLTIFYQAGKRMVHPADTVDARMIAVGSLALVLNLVIALRLKSHSRADVNLRGAFLHALGDALSSLLVAVGGMLILWTGRKIFDPLAALILASILIYCAYGILRDSLHILLEGAPKGMESGLVVKAIEEVTGAGSVLDLHIWNLCSHICALSVHVRLPGEKMSHQKLIQDQVHLKLEEKFNIVHTTIQIESQDWRDQRGGKSYAEKEKISL